MDKEPLVSILIPLYNSQEHISETIESCLNQTYKRIEIIIVDDGSTDSSAKIVQKYANSHNNIRYYRQKNSGAPRARNLAFEKSKGEYIQYLDADDLLSINKISSQIELLKRYNFDPYIVCSSKFSYFKDSLKDAKYFSQPIDRSYDSGIEWLIDAWSGGGFGVIMGWLTHRELIKEVGIWDERLKKNQDGEFFSRVLLSAKRVIMTDDTMVYYRRTGSHSISSSRSRSSIYSTLESLKKYEENIKRVDNIKLKEALALGYANFIREYHETHPDITKEAQEEIIKLGFDVDKLPYRGKFGYIVKLTGFYNAIKMWRVYQHLRSNSR